MTAILADRIAPTYDIDFYSDDVIASPFPHYKAMRDLAPVVWLPRNEGYAITRFADVRDALRNHEVFISGRGIMMNEPVNAAAGGATIISMDGARHHEHRRTLVQPLTPAALKPLRETIQSIADDLVEQLVPRGTFDGVADFARVLPVTLVSRLVGLPKEGRERMLEWASGIFNVMGSINDRFHRGAPAREMAEAYLKDVKREDLLEGSWGLRLLDLVEEGVITDATARNMLFDYVAPALDTTINATSGALLQFGRNPEQWDLVRADPKLIPAAIDESIRLETPIRAFSRYVSRDHRVDGILLPAGSRVLLVYASANRDERRWPDADRFDIRRNAVGEQLAFGTGAHMCVGMHLAKLEMRCLFEALAKRVARFEIWETRRELHNLLNSISSMKVRIVQ